MGKREEGIRTGGQRGRHTVLVICSFPVCTLCTAPSTYNPCPIIQLELLIVITWEFMHIITNHLEARCMGVDRVSVVLYRH